MTRACDTLSLLFPLCDKGFKVSVSLFSKQLKNVLRWRAKNHGSKYISLTSNRTGTVLQSITFQHPFLFPVAKGSCCTNSTSQSRLTHPCLLHKCRSLTDHAHLQVFIKQLMWLVLIHDTSLLKQDKQARYLLFTFSRRAVASDHIGYYSIFLYKILDRKISSLFFLGTMSLNTYCLLWSKENEYILRKN